jgi:hypothetical protein
MLAGCATLSAPPARDPLGAAEAIIDAFYSFESAALRSAMADAPGSIPAIVYYQGWAQGGNYTVLERKPCRTVSAAEIACSIKVRDDLIQALGTGYDVTDTFHMTVADGRIVKIATSSDDPPAMAEAFKWLRARSPEIWTTGPCRGFFAGGPTPQDCVRAVVKGFAEYRARP